jgi:hypothetical protein
MDGLRLWAYPRYNIWFGSEENTIPRCVSWPPLGTFEALSPRAQTTCKACVYTSAEQIRKSMKRAQTSNATYVFLSFWMSVALVNSRQPSDSEFHLKLFLEIFEQVSMKTCIIVRRANMVNIYIYIYILTASRSHVAEGSVYHRQPNSPMERLKRDCVA